MRALTLGLRAAGALALGAAVIDQLVWTIEKEASGGGNVGFAVVNFFSLFTIESSLLALTVLAMGLVLAVRPAWEPGWFGTARAAATTFMVVTGVVFNVLLRDTGPGAAAVPWSNEVLHVAGPVIMLLDWLISPATRPLPRWTLAWIAGFPIVWAVYTMLRGALATDPGTGVGWYPYPFLDPGTSANGYASVALYVLSIAAMIALVGTGLVRLERHRSRGAVPARTSIP
ncbi:Pr6Pr family membrane protein [Arthrobacter halodurans]|uniref:Pr6Pr family membrane protein n=1 Tax=Arthrobacter halodurans TaxID=516699 RepID=A0ABV4UIG3_9MICC